MGSRGWSTVLVAVLTLALALPVHAATTSWKCGNSGCKYDQTRVKYVEPQNRVYTVQQHHIWGSTASGTCDPTNDGIRWRAEKSELWADGVRLYNFGPYVYYTNCQIDNVPPPPGWKFLTVNKTYDFALNAYSRHYIFHDHACAGCDFTDVITNTLPTN